MIPDAVRRAAKEEIAQGWTLLELEQEGKYILDWPDEESAPDVSMPAYSYDGTEVRVIPPLAEEWFSLIPDE